MCQRGYISTGNVIVLIVFGVKRHCRNAFLTVWSSRSEWDGMTTFTSVTRPVLLSIKS